MSIFNLNPSRVAGFALGVIVGTFVMVAAASAQPVQQQKEIQSSGVRVKLKDGALVTPAEVAKRNKVIYAKKFEGLFGFTILERERLVPLTVAQSDAERLRADPDVLAASADYVIEASHGGAK